MSARPSAIETLRAAGRRITPERELLVRIIDRNPHLDASEIYGLAKEAQPRIGLATVYRTLKLLKELGVVHASELGETHRHYEVQVDEHIHLVCSECGRVVDVPAPKHLRSQADAHGFQVERYRLELIGRCAACMARGRRVGEA
jgi:Fe2+ or Zn2+ uptake regulation protein